VLAVDIALERLATIDPEQACVVELRFFARLRRLLRGAATTPCTRAITAV
jgi:hypothetical protein